jgi:hypothetical protein
VDDPFAAAGNGLAGIRLINATAAEVGPIAPAEVDGAALTGQVSPGRASRFAGVAGRYGLGRGPPHR